MGFPESENWIYAAVLFLCRASLGRCEHTKRGGFWFPGFARSRKSAGPCELRRHLRPPSRWIYHFYIRSSEHMKDARTIEATRAAPAPRVAPPAESCGILAFDEKRVGQVRAAMLPPNTVSDLADIFRLLAHPTRLRIVHALAQHELCVCDLAQILDLSVSATSHQLRALRQAKLVRCRMSGKFAYYSVGDRVALNLSRAATRHLANGEDER